MKLASTNIAMATTRALLIVVPPCTRWFSLSQTYMNPRASVVTPHGYENFPLEDPWLPKERRKLPEGSKIWMRWLYLWRIKEYLTMKRLPRNAVLQLLKML